jgi:hypothetical protein
MFCVSRFSVTPDGAQSTPCESWRSLDGAHAELRTATPEQHARLRLEREPADIIPAKAKPAPSKIPAPTPFDAAALRAGKPTTGQAGLF